MGRGNLYIVRHGVAEEENSAHPGNDHWRRLTPEGADRVRRGALGMVVLGVDPEVIWSSPHVRARQTAELLAEALKPSDGIVAESALSFGGSVSAVMDRLSAAVGPLMLVGHNPMFGDLVSELVSGGRLRIHLKKASLVHVRLHEVPRGVAGELVSVVPPRALRAIGANAGRKG